MNVTIPALLFTQSAQSVKPALLASAWPLLLLPFAWVPLGLALGAAVVRLTRPPLRQRGAVVAACAFGNSTGLPVVLLSLVGDALVTPAARAQFGAALEPLSYLSLYLVFYPVLQWSVGGALLGLGATPAPHAPPPPERRLSLEMRATSSPRRADGYTVLDEAAEAAEAGAGAVLAAPSAAATSPPPPRWDAARLAAAARTYGRAALRQLLIPPVAAALSGAFIGLLPLPAAAQSSFASPLSWLLSITRLLGAAAVPVNLLLLGGALSRGPAAVRAAVDAHTLVAVTAAKLLLMPAAAAAICAAGRGALPRMAEPYDDAMALVALLVAATPTANNVLVMVEAAGGDADAVAALIAVQYAVAPVLLTLTVSLFLAAIAVKV